MLTYRIVEKAPFTIVGVKRIEKENAKCFGD